MDELNRLTLEESLHANKHPIFVLLDNIRSMNNVGSIFRTADAFGIEGMILCGLTPQPPHRDIQKTALGATESVSWRYQHSISTAIEELRQSGYEIWAIEQTHNSVFLSHFQLAPRRKIAFIFGNEVNGVSDEALALCDGSIEIRQWGTKHSLNVSVTAGIVLWEFVRKLNTPDQ